MRASKPQDPALVAKAIAPDYALGSHVAPLGLAFYTGKLLAARYRDGAFIGLHGSWNRKPKNGYTVVFVPFANGKPSGPIEQVLGGFVNQDGDAQGRPVGVAVDARGRGAGRRRRRQCGLAIDACDSDAMNRGREDGLTIMSIRVAAIRRFHESREFPGLAHSSPGS